MTTKNKDEVYQILADNYPDFIEGNLDKDLVIQQLYDAVKYLPKFERVLANANNEKPSEKKQDKKLLGWVPGWFE